MSTPWAKPEIWDTAAAKYNDAVGRSSRIGAKRLIELSPISRPDARAIDLGAGTGSLTRQLAASFPNLPILGTDISPGMLDALISLDKKKGSQITTQVVDMASPIGGEASEGKFSHVFSTMAIQVLPDPASDGTLGQWARLLKPGGVIAIALWNFDENCGPHAIWNEAATAVDPNYVPPPILTPQAWTGCADLEKGLERSGFLNVKTEVVHLGFDVGKEGFLKFFWESGNPMPVDRQGSFKGDLDKVRVEMEKFLEVKYDRGTRIPLSAAVGVGEKPKTD
ncbi:hypothetical protein HYALB_00009812 [Hymenoscyphus albidus]|uniref:Methyltransferase domain-containing protein n=1 Tax=Hymenoscyphus albidus TaxID=595503 RepID=A0A9N9LLQ1_9HELO|nr:hypothetical protein HYALB_00009812 [Hymenoscyphus albidus]